MSIGEQQQFLNEVIKKELVENGYDLSNINIKQMSLNVIEYYENPDLMIYLKEEEKEMYDNFVNILSNKIYLKNHIIDNNSGFSNIVILTFVIIILAVLLLMFII